MNTVERAHLLAQRSWTEVVIRGDTTVLAVPLGSTEQHGPHLPLSTDTDIAVELARRLARARSEVAVAPALPYGSSGEHASFAGTLSLGAPALEAVLVEIGRSADAFAGVVFVCAHGGNAKPLRRAVDRLTYEGRRVRAWQVGPAGVRDDAHAGFSETSVMMALAPQAVRAEALRPGCPTPIGALMPALESSGVAAVSPSGVLGDPSDATAEAGRMILDRWETSLLAALEGWP